MKAKDIVKIRTPEDVVEVFEALKEKAEEIGFPIAFDVSGQPVELYYHQDYDFVLVDKSELKMSHPPKSGESQDAEVVGITYDAHTRY